MNGRMKTCLALIFFTLSAGILFSFGKKDDPQKAQNQNAVPVYDSGYYNTAAAGQMVVITGTVRLVGSDPFPRYVLTEAEKYDWYIPDPADRKVISDFEQQIVTIKGTVVLREVILANGKRAGTERILKSISLVK